jgi:hypothetical protein
MRNIRENLFFALVYNAAGVPVAAGILYPFLGLLISPIFAAAAMSPSSVSVIGNALRLRQSRRLNEERGRGTWRRAPGLQSRLAVAKPIPCRRA